MELEILKRTNSKLVKWKENDNNELICSLSLNFDEVLEKEVFPLKNTEIKSTLKDYYFKDKYYTINFFKYKEELYSLFEIPEKINSNFLFNISYEIRTPLNGILAMTALLNDTTLSDEQKDYTNQINESSYNIIEIFNDVIDYIKLSNSEIHLHTEPVNLKLVLNESISIVSSKIKKKYVNINYKIDPDINPDILSNSQRLKQILVNILTNVVQYSDKPILVDISLLDSHLHFYIEDKSLGYSKEDTFKMNNSLNDISDFNLNLPITQKLVKLLGGYIKINSEINKGTTICFTIDYKEIDNGLLNFKDKTILIVIKNEKDRLLIFSELTKYNIQCYICSNYTESIIYLDKIKIDLIITDEDLKFPRNTEVLKISDNQNISNFSDLAKKIKEVFKKKNKGGDVLVAEDVYLNQKVLVGYLNKIGVFNIDIAENGEEVLDLMKTKTYSLIFLDIKMPVMDGLSCFKLIKKNYPDITTKVIATTAIHSEGESFLNLGMHGYLVKPINFTELQKIIHHFGLS